MPEQAPPRVILRCIATTVGIAGISVTRELGMQIEAGQCWCILGQNGVGKSTLLHTLAGLHNTDSGSIELNGRPLDSFSRRRAAQQVSILFQDHDDAFPATVMETVLQGRHPHLHPWQWESATDVEIAQQALELVGLQSFAQRNVQTLSGGERQRAAIAALLAQDTPLLLLDEPTNHLDLHHRIGILERLLAHCRKQGKSLVMVLHDINLAARFADRVLLLLGEGNTRHGAAREVLQTQTLENLFDHPLVEVETPSGPAWLPA